MPNTQLEPELPGRVRRWTKEYAGHRHPQLAQGRLFHHWHGNPNDRPIENVEKTAECARQAENITRFFTDVAKQLLTQVVARQRQPWGNGSVPAGDDLRVTHRLLIGSGLPNPIETGLTLHPLYGAPYLPASAIKGVTQHWLLTAYAAEAGIPRLSGADAVQRARQDHPAATMLALFEELLLAAGIDDAAWTFHTDRIASALGAPGDDSASPRSKFQEWIEQSEGRKKGILYRALFGAPPLRYRDADEDKTNGGQRGSVVYLDAFPTALHMEAAVLTPHASPYYGAVQQMLPAAPTARPTIPSPGDYHDPIPVPFVVVGKNSVFAVTVRAPEQRLADAALAVVRRALAEHGIGAKTGVGYGTLT